MFVSHSFGQHVESMSFDPHDLLVRTPSLVQYADLKVAVEIDDGVR